MRATPRQLSATDKEVRSKFRRGLEVDLHGQSHPIRAAVLADLLARPIDRAAHPRAALRLRHATIIGGLDLRHAEITVPVSISQSTFSEVPDFAEARGVSPASGRLCIAGPAGKAA